MSYATFSSATFTARTSASDYTQTASVADVFLDTLSELATTRGTGLSTLLTTQTTPLLETESFAISTATNLALVDTTETVASVITGGTKAQAVKDISTSIRTVVTALGTKDKTAVAAAKAVGAAISSSIASSSGLTSSTELSNLANNVALLVQSSVTSLVRSPSASSLSAADLSALARTLGTNQGTALRSVDLSGSSFTPAQVGTQLGALTTSLNQIGAVIQNTANSVASGTPLNQALGQSAAALATTVTQATTTANTVAGTISTINLVNTVPLTVEPVVTQQPVSPS